MARIWHGGGYESDRGSPGSSSATGLPTHGPDLADSSLYLNRDLSWLAFNERVLDQARGTSHPLLERVKFLAIAASNLDEFFMVRLGSIPFSATGQGHGHARARLAEFWEQELRPELAAERILFIEPADYTDRDRTFLEKHFNVHVCPVLTPLAFDPGHPFPYISNLSKNLAIVVDHRGRTKFARVKVPDLLPRFLSLPTREGEYRRLAMLEDVIRENLASCSPASASGPRISSASSATWSSPSRTTRRKRCSKRCIAA